MENLATLASQSPPSSMRRSRPRQSSPPPSPSSPSLPSSSPPNRKTTTVVALIVLAATCFHLGVMVGIGVGQRWSASDESAQQNASRLRVLLRGERLRRQVTERCVCDCDTSGKQIASPPPNKNEETVGEDSRGGASATKRPAAKEEFSQPLIATSNLVAGAVHVKRNDFASVVDAGVPIEPNDARKNDVLILYTSERSLPTSDHGADMSPAARAVENCLTMKVVFTELDAESNCIAVVGHPEESYHVHRFHRVVRRTPTNPEEGDNDEIQQVKGIAEVSREAPLRPVPRTVETSGKVQDSSLPSRAELDHHFEELSQYLGGLEATLDSLRPIAKAAASSSSSSSGDGNTVVAMVVNHGQSDLLMNFVCSARSRNLDLSQVLVFATDSAAARLATSLGVTVFEVQGAFGAIPTEAAEYYGDEVFGKVVPAKIYCVQLLVHLGHNVLFQDVDVVWRRHPLEYFASFDGTADMIFQDDGNRQPRFAPYFANTGFYFVRSNIRTRYLFSALIRMSDVVKTLWSDQETLSIFLTEHVSWKGLRVKVLGRDTPDGRLFPCGYHFHVDKDYMRQMMKGEGIEPYVFHMNWTPGKAEKLKFLSQMGEWHVSPHCSSETATECCSAVPVLECHYRDVPSPLDCRNSPPLQGDDEPPFWPEPQLTASDS